MLFWTNHLPRLDMNYWGFKVSGYCLSESQMSEQVAQMDMKMFSCFSHQYGVAFNMTQLFTGLRTTRAERLEGLLCRFALLWCKSVSEYSNATSSFEVSLK